PASPALRTAALLFPCDPAESSRRPAFRPVRCPWALLSLAPDPPRAPSSGPPSLLIYHPTPMARSAQLADLFRSPALVAQRNYEICKAYYLDGATAEQLAERFSLHPDSVRALVRDFAHAPDLEQFFVVNRPGRQTAPKRDALLEDAVRLRQQGLTLAQIEQHLREQGHSISESYLSRLLARQNLADIQAS